ncbi:GNAT family N-acetyltransferase [Marinicauda salina]|nr:N-acetyltransferase [Marinicauda salina]
MTADIAIRPARPDDMAGLETLYPAAFPDEDLLGLVRALSAEGPTVVSLVAERDGRVIGHVCVSICGVGGRPNAAGLLGPLAVAPEAQGQGLGRALVETGLERMADAGVDAVCVLGDPGYYGRYGFEPGTGIAPPYPMPEEWREAWQGLRTSPDAPRVSGRLEPPAPWMDEALWRP